MQIKINCNVLITLYIHTGCDATSKIGPKHTAVKVDTVTALKDFGEGIYDVANHVQDVETFLVKVWKPSAKQTTLDDLRYIEFKRSGKIDDLSPTSAAIRGHIYRSDFLVRQNINALNNSWTTENPRAFFWIEENETLLPDKCLRRMPDELLVTCGCTTCADDLCKCRRKMLHSIEYC